MKIFVFLFIALLILTWCFWGESSPTATWLVIQETESFSIPTPSTWQSIPLEDLIQPKSGEIALAFRSNTPRQWYINNIVILQQENASISAQAIIESGIESLEKWIKWYSLISNRDIQFADNAPGKLIIYSGKYSTDTPETVYIQSARVCGDTGYYMTISLTEKLESYDRYEYILQNFRCN